VALFDITPLHFRSLLTAEGVKAKPKEGDIFRAAPLAFSPDGTLLVTGGVAGHLVGWDIEVGTVRFRIPHEGRANDVVFFPDGGSFLVAGPSIQRFSASNGQLIAEFKPPGIATATALAMSSDGRVILAGLSTGNIAKYDAAAGNLLHVIKGHAVAVTGLAFAPDDSAFASNAGRFDPRVWNAKDGAPVPIRLKELEGIGESLDKSAQELQALTVLAWVLGTAAGFHTVGAPTMGAPPIGAAGPTVDRAAVTPSHFCGPRVAYSPDGRFLATTAHLGMLSGEFQLILVDLTQRKARLMAGNYGCSVAFSSDSKLVIRSGNGAPQIWDAETGERIDKVK
jgi:WD40 repeat protein